MSFFNDAQIEGMFGGPHPCPKCGIDMEWENEWEDVLICPNCGHDVSIDEYGYTKDEYDALYPTKEEVCGYEDEPEDDEYGGENYDEVYGELSDD